MLNLDATLQQTQQLRQIRDLNLLGFLDCLQSRLYHFQRKLHLAHTEPLVVFSTLQQHDVLHDHQQKHHERA